MESLSILPSLVRSERLQLAVIYVDGGDPAKGQRGLIGDQSTIDRFRETVRLVLQAAEICDCRLVNIPIGMRSDRY